MCQRNIRIFSKIIFSQITGRKLARIMVDIKTTTENTTYIFVIAVWIVLFIFNRNKENVKFIVIKYICKVTSLIKCILVHKLKSCQLLRAIT